jgi:hypothetical protein
MAEVESATGKVRGNHEGNLISAKTLEDRYASRLFQASVDIPYRFKSSFQFPYQFLAAMS